MLKAFRLGRLAVTSLALLAGLILWIYSAVDNALNYTETAAVVERMEEVCTIKGVRADCQDAISQSKGRPPMRHTAVFVRYTSPADGRQHVNPVIPIGGTKAVEATRLHPGDRWTILAHHKKPADIKVD